MASLRDASAVTRSLAIYRRVIIPRVRAELRRWERLAETIPGRILRQNALAALRAKGQNVEATAVFATLAPPAYRGDAVEAMAAFQVAVDYLDNLGEQPAKEPLQNGLQLHLALRDALAPRMAAAEWYRLHPQQEDGGYLNALVEACRKTVGSLPSHVCTLALAQRAALRCGEGQSYTHAATGGKAEGLRSWASRQDSPPGYAWWEIAAGASSSVAVHALIAAAADPRTTAEAATLIDAAYFPAIGALTVLLDDLIDFDEDTASGAHNYMGYYESNLIAADRIAMMSSRAKAAAAKLPQGRRHVAILAGIAGFYLSTPAARAGSAAPIRSRMIQAIGFPVRPILAVMRLSRRD